MSGLLAAARYLTIVPLRAGAEVSASELGRAAAWFPVVGLLLGGAVAVGERGAGALFPPLLAASATLALWKTLTGGLHLDGLADCLDGLVGRDRAHRLAIMRDSRIGTFGAVGLVLVLVLQLAAIAELPATLRPAALLAAPAVARAAPGLLGRLHPPARGEGLGATFAAGLGRGGALAGVAFAVGVAALLLGPGGVVAAVVALALVLAVGAFMSGRLGGVTGDVHGAAIEVAELAVLAVVAAWAHARP